MHSANLCLHNVSSRCKSTPMQRPILRIPKAAAQLASSICCTEISALRSSAKMPRRPPACWTAVVDTSAVDAFDEKPLDIWVRIEIKLPRYKPSALCKLSTWMAHHQPRNLNCAGTICAAATCAKREKAQHAWASAIGTTNPHMVAKALTKGFQIACLKHMTKSNQKNQDKKLKQETNDTLKLISVN